MSHVEMLLGFSRIIGVRAADSEMCLEEMLEDLLMMNKVVVSRIGKVCSLIVVEIFGSAVCMRFFLDFLFFLLVRLLRSLLANWPVAV